MHRKLSPLHFVGIGGIGMAALAELLHLQGLQISGSDLVAGATFERLGQLGVCVSIGHDASRIEGVTTVVRSSAIADDNPELVAAREKGIEIIGRGALLAEIMRPQHAIAIGGSHGKTTTSAMTAHLLEVAGLDPTALIGGRVPRAQGGASPTRLGNGKLIENSIFFTLLKKERLDTFKIILSPGFLSKSAIFKSSYSSIFTSSI